jgi:DNA polymerase-3 subunit delta
MVAISNGDADAFLSAPFARHGVILIHGSDRGLVSERVSQAARNYLGAGSALGQKIQLAGDAIAADPMILVDEANSIDMFESSNRCIVIGVGSKSLLPALELIRRAPPQHCLIVLEGGELRRDAPLRKWAEMQDCAAAIECRQDDARSLLRLVEKECAMAGVALEPSARDALLGVLGEDRLATRNEIEKLLLFASGKEVVTLSDVQAICYDSSVAQTDAIVDGFFSLSRQDLLALLLNADQSGADTTTLLLAILRHVLALQRACGAANAGAGAADALQSLLRSTGGYNRKTELTRQLKSCDAHELVQLIRTIQGFTKATRESTTLSSQRFTRLLLSHANSRR